MAPRQPAKVTSARTPAAEPLLREGRSRTGRVRLWHSRLMKAASMVLLIAGLPALVAAAYSAYVRGQLWLTGAAVLSIPGLLVVAALSHFLPRADDRVVGSRRLSKGTGAQHEELSGVIAERTRGLAAVAEVAHTTTSVLDPSVLLPQVVELVCDRFDLYYVGLFLVDEERGFALLKAGSGAAGRQMLAQGHRLEVGGESMIGQCVATGEPDVQLDVGEAAVRFDNPLLPETRSELALPLRVRERVIGALTVQSERANAFDDTSVSLLQTMADQVAVAIDNARLFAESQAALDEMRAVQQRYTVQAWRGYLAEGRASPSVTVGDGVDEGTITAEIRQALGHGGATVISAPPPAEDGADRQGHSALVLPIVLRGRTIGVLGVHDPDAQRGWSEPDIALAEAVVERLAFAAENLRLLDVTQRRAAREQLTAQIGQRVREAADLREIMHVAADALGQELGASEVVFRLGTAESLLGVQSAE
jgi:GAF domain-containing protein